MTLALVVAVVALLAALAGLWWQRRRLQMLQSELSALADEARAERESVQQALLRLGEHSLRLERRLNRAVERYQWQLAEPGEDATPEHARALLKDMEAGIADGSEAELALRRMVGARGSPGKESR